MSIPIAAILSSILFSLIVHFNQLSGPFVVFSTLIGLLFVLLFLKTGSLWFSIGFYWTYDWCQGGIGLLARYQYQTQKIVRIHRARAKSIFWKGAFYLDECV